MTRSNTTVLHAVPRAMGPVYHCLPWNSQGTHHIPHTHHTAEHLMHEQHGLGTALPELRRIATALVASHARKVRNLFLPNWPSSHLRFNRFNGMMSGD